MVNKLQGRDSTRWDALSRRYRKLNPLCEMCMKEGRVSASQLVDHIVPHKGNIELLFDSTNLQALCTPCHSARKQSLERKGYDVAIGKDGWPTDPLHPNNSLPYHLKEK